MKIGIFGGTFSPIHEGHINIINNIKTKLNLDIIYFVPTYKTPDKTFEIEKINPLHRYKMVDLTIKNINEPWLKISNFEFKEQNTSYTFKTIKHFKEKFPNDKIYWIMGEDRYFGFDKWKNSQYIRDSVKLIVYRRSEKINKKLVSDKSIIYVSNKFYNVSSTKILTNIEWDKIPEPAKKYIAKNKLYLKTLVFNVLKDRKYQHSIAVSSHAKRLSAKYNYKKIDDAILAGLVHDLFKLKDLDWQRKYYDKYNDNVNVPFIPDAVLHGFICSMWLKNEYGIKNKEILNSIKYHTIAKDNMNKLEKIIFVADAIATDRKGDKIGKLRKLAYLDLDQTFKKILKYTYKNQEKNHDGAHYYTIMAIKQYTNIKIKNKLHTKNSLKK